MKNLNLQSGRAMLPRLILATVISLMTIISTAQPLLIENFDYSIGALLTDNGWTAHSGAGTQSVDVTNGLIFDGYAGSGIGGAANLDNNGEDVHRTFTEQTSGTVYAAFIIQTQSTNASGYFLHLGRTTIGTTFFSRVWVNATGDQVGIGTAASVSVTPGVPTLLVIKFDFATSVSSLFVFNSFPASEPTVADATYSESGITNVGSIALRQFNTAERVVVDGIRVATTWAEAVAPSSGTNPAISASPGTLSGFTYTINNGPSASQSYNLSGSNLTPASGNITVTPPTNYEISLDDISFSQSVLNVPYTAGALSAVPVYVRLKAGLNGGTYTGEQIINAGGGATNAVVTCNGNVEAPATTTLPYSEDFSSGFGLCYTKSVSGPSQFWKHSTSGEYAYMNGFNTGVLEEDWLILPGINLNENFNCNLSFESWMRYGSDDTDNYFKVLYSTDYPGVGDPTSSTWSELTFDYPAEEQVWTPSGAIDLSAIMGSNVYIAFKYHYNAGFYRLWQVDNISVIPGDMPVITATPATLSGFTYEVGSGPSAAQTYAVSGENLVGSGNITVTAPASYEISLDGSTFAASLSLPFAGGIITGQPVTVSVRLKEGLGIGSYNNEVISHSGGNAVEVNVTCSGSVTDLVPYFSVATIPAFIQGINGTNSQRVPYAFSATVSNLYPNTTYRYFNKIVVGTDSPTSNGAGNTIFVNADGSFLRTTSTNLGNPGEYGEFTTDANGEYTGWFMIEPSGNTRFTPGNQLFMRIMLNDGNEGTSVVNRVTSAEAATVINFGNQNLPEMGTGIRGISEAAAGNLVYLYDNVAGTGRPVYGSSIETTGVDFAAAGTYVGFYTGQVQGVNGSWGGIVPNLLPDGIRRIEERSNADGSLVALHTSENGVWGIYDTRNPFGGEVDILIIDLLPSGEPLLTVSPATLSGFNYVEGSGPSEVQTYLLSGTDLEGSGNITVTAPADYEISADGTSFGTTLEFAYTDGNITGQPVTVSVRLKAGLTAGDYNGQTILNSGGGATDKVVTCNGSVSAAVQPGITGVILPQYVQGINGTNNSRVPYAFWATLENLTPEATYRYFNKVVLESDLPTADGAGNCIFIAADGTYSRTTSTSLANPGEYGEFTTDVTGAYTGWFIAEPTGNARFTPGNQIFMRISINDGAGGSDVAHRLTTADYATVLQFGVEAYPTQGTAIMGVSEDTPKDFALLYDNTAGAGRPLYAAHIESSEVDFASITSYAPFYISEVAGTDGSWGGIVPNVNDAGVQRVEIRSGEDGTIVHTYEVPSGVWIETDTRNPSGGLDNVLVLDLISIGIDQPQISGLQVYAYGRQITVKAADHGAISFVLYNLQGQQVYSRQLNGSDEYTFGLNIPAGLYVAKIIRNAEHQSYKLIVR